MMEVIGPDSAGDPLQSSADIPVETKQGRYRHSSAGFTLVELIVVSAIIGVLAGLAIPAYNQFIQKIKVTRVISEIRTLEKDITARLIDSNTLPNSLADIGRDDMRDPWGNFYQYLNFANPGTPRQDNFTFDLNVDFDIYSLGPDGLSDTNIKAVNSLDDIIRTSNGGWVGTGEDF